MATTFNRYGGPHIDLAYIRAHTKLFEEKYSRGPTEDEIVAKIHEKKYRSLSEDWIREYVRDAISIGVRVKALNERIEKGKTRYYYSTRW